jgi:hypothetical protein
MRSRWVLNLRLPILQANEHDLDPVVSFVAKLIIFDELIARLSSWDARGYSLFDKGSAKPIRVISSVCQ